MKPTPAPKKVLHKVEDWVDWCFPPEKQWSYQRRAGRVLTRDFPWQPPKFYPCVVEEIYEADPYGDGPVPWRREIVFHPAHYIELKIEELKKQLIDYEDLLEEML